VANADPPIVLNWVDSHEPAKGFQPRRIRTAETPFGRYEVFEDGPGMPGFDAWFTKRSTGVLINLGKSKTANGARETCERHAKTKGTRP
jgi:hypothetical protein